MMEVWKYPRNYLSKSSCRKNVMKSSDEYLKTHSQHVFINAFDNIDFAGFPRGVFGCTPHDMMHCILEGVLKYATRIFIDGFTSRKKAEIDLLVDNLFRNFHSSEDPLMPRKKFSRGKFFCKLENPT